MLSLIAAAAASKQGGGAQIVQGSNTYPTAALLLASYADEMHAYDEGARWANKGLAMQPYNWMLSLEAASCTMALHHPAESYQVLKDALDNGGFTLSDEAKARLLRNEGSALIELNRLDEAEAAEHESIRLMPNNPQAQNELQYIARLRAGGPATDVTIGIPQNPPPDSDNQPGNKGN
jgi:tetratricopeptide (TPR) repeat protein